MRFQIDCCWSGSPLYRLHLREAEITVERAARNARLCWTHSELRWTWWDDTEYAILFPRPVGQAKEPFVRIVSGGRTICRGRIVYPPLRSWPLLTALPRLEWEYDAATLVCGPRRCRNVVRQRGGRRLAVWRPRRWYWWFSGCEGVWRKDLPGPAAAVVFGVILAQLHGFREE